MEVFSQSAGLQNNAYVLIRGDKALVIDPSFLVPQVEALLARERLELAGVLLTHAHFDHMGDGQRLAAAHSAMVHVPIKDRPLFALGLLSKWRSYDSADHTCFFAGGPLVPGFDVRTIPMPGHSPGSVGYVIDGHFFTGDSVLQSHLGPDNLPLSSPADFDQTVRDFMLLPDEWIIMPGHYGYGQTLKRVKRENTELLDRLKKIA